MKQRRFTILDDFMLKYAASKKLPTPDSKRAAIKFVQGKYGCFQRRPGLGVNGCTMLRQKNIEKEMLLRQSMGSWLMKGRCLGCPGCMCSRSRKGL